MRFFPPHFYVCTCCILGQHTSRDLDRSGHAECVFFKATQELAAPVQLISVFTGYKCFLHSCAFTQRKHSRKSDPRV